MGKQNSRKPSAFASLPLKLQVLAVAVVLLVILVAWLFRSVSTSKIEIEADQTIDITPEQIESIEEIGQWEFLSISDEEMVDTVRRGFFSDDHLARIYYGTLRLGVDLQNMEEGWITTVADTLYVTLPPVGLLDSDFIDEARTKSFAESGRWTADDREALYRRAQHKMMRQALTPQNINIARQNGEAQVRQVLRSMGFERVSIAFRDAE